MAQNRIIRPGEQVIRLHPNGMRIALGRGTPTVIGGGGGATAPLKFGPYAGMSGLTGIGPGGDTGAPYYRIVGTNPHSEGVTVRGASVDLADALDITIFATVVNSPSTFGAGSPGTFSLTNAIAQLNKIQADEKYSDAINRRRVIPIVWDEPYLQSKWGNTFTPQMARQLTREHKLRWPTCITVGRGDPIKMRNGWAGQSTGASFWDALDYCVMQFEGPQAQDFLSFGEALAIGRADAAAVGLLVVPTLNLWAGGNQATTLGVPHCWDYLNNGSSSGVVCGSVQASGSGLSPGDQLTCAQWAAVPTANKRTLFCSPAWIEAVINEVYADPNIPWLCAWCHPISTLASWGIPYSVRADWVPKMDYAITKCLSRPAANPIPAPKVYP